MTDNGRDGTVAATIVGEPLVAVHRARIPLGRGHFQRSPSSGNAGLQEGVRHEADGGVMGGWAYESLESAF